VLGWSLCNLGRVAEGLAHLQRAQLLASAEQDIPTLLWTRGQLAAGLLASGRAAAAIDAASGVLDLGRSLGAEAAYGPYSATPRIEAMILLGHWASAQQLIGRLLDLDPPGGAAAFPRMASGLLRLWQGEVGPARADLVQALRDSEQSLVPEVVSVAHARLARRGSGAAVRRRPRAGEGRAEVVRRIRRCRPPHPSRRSRRARRGGTRARRGCPAPREGPEVTWRRTQMVSWSAQGMSVAQIAGPAFTRDDRVRDVLRNFNADGLDSLYPRTRAASAEVHAGPAAGDQEARRVRAC
jgi:hypothetical protein